MILLTVQAATVKEQQVKFYDDFISHAMEEKIFFRKDDDMNIKYISVENSIAEWADKKEF